ncbi:MAG: hypothetical protein ACPGUD_09855 [Parashewanella sp.]
MKLITYALFLYAVHGVALAYDNVSGEQAKVDIYAEPAGSYHPLANIIVSDALKKTKIEQLTFDGKYYQLTYPIGQDMSLLFSHRGYKTSQSGLFKIGGQSYIGPHHLISWQPINSFLWAMLKKIIELDTLTKMGKDRCQLIATVTAYNMTMDDDPQGEPGATVKLINKSSKAATDANTSNDYDKTYYFGILAGKTLPVPGLTATTADGGIMILNIKPGKYALVAEKQGVQFSSPTFICDPSQWRALGKDETMLINLSPPQGPIVQK